MKRPVIVLPGCLLLSAFAGCHHDLPTAPAAARPAAPSPLGTALAAFPDAVTDAQTRALPALGAGAGVDALARALVDLQGAISHPDTATLYVTLERARAAVSALQTDSTDLQDLDVVLLVLDGIYAAAHAVPDATATAAPCMPAPDPGNPAVLTCQ